MKSQTVTTPLLDVRNLNGGYGDVTILRGISLNINPGEIVGIIGHNGMGKTTLIKHLMGYLPAHSGQINFYDEDITDLTVWQRGLKGIGYVPQGRGIFPELTTEEHLYFAAAYLKEAHLIQARVEEVFDQFPRLKEIRERKGHVLSGGEKQILAIARCIAVDPLLMLLDEPTEGIQPSINHAISEQLRYICNDQGMSILLMEQNLEFLSKTSDRLLIIEKGQIIDQAFIGSTEARNMINAYAGLSGETSVARKFAPSLTSSPPSPIFPPQVTHDHSSFEAEKLPLIAGRDLSNFSHETHQFKQTTQSHPKGDTTMSVQRPQLNHMRSMAERMGMTLSDSELLEYLQVMTPYLDGYDLLDQTPDVFPEIRYPRTPGFRPDPAENRLNAWYVKTHITGASSGQLKDKTIALKDTVCVAGVPMMNGASILEGYIPDTDATIVTRLLDAGGIIAGKAHCEYLCLSGGSHTNATGPVHNPWKRGFMAGGSSSGSAALVAAGEVDLAIAGDQGGSIRIPASNCGVYGMKPTHGLVPYSGVFPIEQTIDHVGPITNNVHDNAMMLEVLAGADGLDPRQYNPQVEAYSSALGRGVSRLRIGLLREGFDRPESEVDVDAAVRHSADILASLGANIIEISVPDHMLAPAAWTSIAVEGLQDLMMHGNASGTNYKGLFLPGLTDYFAGWRGRADELSASLKTCMFLGEYFQTTYRGKFYGKSQNISRRIKASYLSVFNEIDLLLMPTLPMKAQPIPAPDASITEVVQRAFEMVGNTCPFNLNGLPAMTVPCGISDGLPIGMMLVASDWQESTIYRAAYAFEQAQDWKTL